MNINKLLKEQIEQIKVDKPALSKIKKISQEFCEELEKNLKKKKIAADVFIGGSLAKSTLVKKEKQDIDIFVRFDDKYKQKNISKILKGALPKNAKKIHGSRDYYQIIIDGIIFEVVPVIKIKKPQNALNITDLSYFHVNYLKKNLRKNKKLNEEILLAKTFAHAQNCYGAESYINGFSGYALELLIVHYKCFLNFVKNIAKIKPEEKIMIDGNKFYKNKNQILIELNESKIKSPIILIDPTHKERNALAGLSEVTFKKFKKACIQFLKKPGSEFFKNKDVGQELKNKYGNKLKIISIKTTKQKGDISGTKSKKFFEFFKNTLQREFKLKQSFFEYDENKNIAYFYFLLDKLGEKIIKGPPIDKKENLKSFKQKHKKTFIKNKIIYNKEKHNLEFLEFLKIFEKKYHQTTKQMDIKEIKSVASV